MSDRLNLQEQKKDEFEREEVETKTSEIHGKTQYYKSSEYLKKQKFLFGYEKLCKSAGSPAVDTEIKGICAKHGEPYEEGVGS